MNIVSIRNFLKLVTYSYKNQYHLQLRYNFPHALIFFCIKQCNWIISKTLIIKNLASFSMKNVLL